MMQEKAVACLRPLDKLNWQGLSEAQVSMSLVYMSAASPPRNAPPLVSTRAYTPRAPVGNGFGLWTWSHLAKHRRISPAPRPFTASGGDPLSYLCIEHSGFARPGKGYS